MSKNRQTFELRDAPDRNPEALRKVKTFAERISRDGPAPQVIPVNRTRSTPHGSFVRCDESNGQVP